MKSLASQCFAARVPIRRRRLQRSGNTSATLVVRSSVSSCRQMSDSVLVTREVRLDEVGLLLERELVGRDVCSGA